MLASVLKSAQAVQMSIFVVRAFVQMRELLASNKDMAEKIDRLEKGQEKQGQHLVQIYRTLDRLMEEPVKKEGKMGFNARI